VLEPLSQDYEAHYRRYDWETDGLAQWHTVPVGGVVVIEGVYAIRKELAKLYDFRVWVHCPRETRLARGLERDGEAARDMWVSNWMVAEDLYVEAHKPYEIADLVMDGTVSGVVINFNGKPNS
jgi:uridine kinase